MDAIGASVPTISVTTSGFVSYLQSRSTFFPVQPLKDEPQGIWGQKAAKVVDDKRAQICLGLLVFLDYVLICHDTDERAAGRSPPFWLEVASATLLAVYAIDLMIRLVAERLEIVKKMWNWIDAFILVCGVLDLLNLSDDVGVLRMLKLVRLMRLLKLARMLRSLYLKELRTLMRMIEACLRTLLWAGLVMLLTMSAWSALSVELVHPVVKQLVQEGEWADCERCHRAFASVMRSNLTFFQTIVGGDSWGLVALPVIERNPWTAVIFIGAIMTLNFGILQLVVCVVVDRFAELRHKDIAERAQDRGETEKLEKDALARMFAQIDKDRNGCVSFEELVAGAERVPEFAQRLTALDIGRENLRELFDILDENGSGELDPREFVECLFRMMTAESQTALHFVRKLLNDVKRHQAAIQKKLCEPICGEGTTQDPEVKAALARLEEQINRLSSSTIHPTDKPQEKTRNADMEREDQDEIIKKELQHLLESSVVNAVQVAVQTKFEVVLNRLDSFISRHSRYGEPWETVDEEKMAFTRTEVDGSRAGASVRSWQVRNAGPKLCSSLGPHLYVKCDTGQPPAWNPFTLPQHPRLQHEPEHTAETSGQASVEYPVSMTGLTKQDCVTPVPHFPKTLEQCLESSSGGSHSEPEDRGNHCSCAKWGVGRSEEHW